MLQGNMEKLRCMEEALKDGVEKAGITNVVESPRNARDAATERRESVGDLGRP